MNEAKYYHDYCTGCGLCCELSDSSEMKMEDNGFRYPDKYDETVRSVCRRVCPVNGRELKDMSTDQVWGSFKGKYLGWSSDEKIRYSASSGGVLTALSKYILEKKLADGIIHFAESSDNVTLGKVYCTDDPEMLIKRCGSRYCSSMPFEGFRRFLEDDKKYVFIGKPCDIRVLHNFLEDAPEYRDKFVYTLSFFCAGAPSEKANLALLKKLGCNDKTECSSLQYRGMGWPGYATARRGEKILGQIDYRSCWRDTLGRDIRKICRFCADGVGELADVSCGDAWYLNDQGQPVFDERQGRNFIFSRTPAGDKLVQQAAKEGYITLENDASLEKLRQAQQYQFMRKATMTAGLSALRLALRRPPAYPRRFFANFKRLTSKNRRLHIFYGTYKRILKGKI